MLLSAVSVLVVAQSSSEIPEGLMNNPVYFCLLRPDTVEKRKIFFPSLVIQPVAYPEYLSKHKNLIQNNVGNPRHAYISLKQARSMISIKVQVILSSA